MLPIITEEISTEIFGEVFQDVSSWRKNMVQYLKEENPESTLQFWKLQNMMKVLI